MDSSEVKHGAASGAPGVGPRWIIPHAALMILCIVSPVFWPSIWKWWTAVWGGGFFGLMLIVDLQWRHRLRQPHEPTPLVDHDHESSSIGHRINNGVPPHARARRGPACPRCGNAVRVPAWALLVGDSPWLITFACGTCEQRLTTASSTDLAMRLAMLGAGIPVVLFWQHWNTPARDVIWPMIAAGLLFMALVSWLVARLFLRIMAVG